MIKFKGISPKKLTLPSSSMFLIKRFRNKTEMLRFGDNYYRRLENNSFQSAKILNCIKSETGVLHIFYEMERNNSGSSKPIQEGRFSLSVEAFFKSFPLKMINS